MTEHRCDPSQDPLDTPVSQLRMLRLIDAYLDDLNLPAILVAHDGFGSCPACLTKALDYAAALITAGMRDTKRQSRKLVQRQIADLERSTGWHGG